MAGDVRGLVRTRAGAVWRPGDSRPPLGWVLARPGHPAGLSCSSSGSGQGLGSDVPRIVYSFSIRCCIRRCPRLLSLMVFCRRLDMTRASGQVFRRHGNGERGRIATVLFLQCYCYRAAAIMLDLGAGHFSAPTPRRVAVGLAHRLRCVRSVRVVEQKCRCSAPETLRVARERPTESSYHPFETGASRLQTRGSQTCPQPFTRTRSGPRHGRSRPGRLEWGRVERADVT